MKSFSFFGKFKYILAILIAGLFFLTAFSHAPQISLGTEIDGIESQIIFNAALQEKSDALLGLFGEMASVPVYLKDETIRDQGANTERGVAYTSCEAHTTPKIMIKLDFYEKTNEKQLTNILRHELTHAWLCRQRLMSGHDENFRRKFMEVGGFGN